MGRGQDRRSVLLTAPEASRPSAWTELGESRPAVRPRTRSARALIVPTAWDRSRGEANWSGPVSRVLCPPREAADGDHFSRTQIALGLEQPTRKRVRGGPPRAAPSRKTLRSSSCLALLPMGFAEPDRSPGLLVSSYLTVSPLPGGPKPLRRFAFCGTVPDLTAGGRYPPSCPAEPGLSSRRGAEPARAGRRAAAGDHPVRSSRFVGHSIVPCDPPPP